MRSTVRKYGFILLALLAITGSAFLDYFLPEHQITRISGVEAKLAGKTGPNPATPPLRDMYLVYTQHNIADVRVYRNEDTGWGWPFYFKFDSSDVQATATALLNAKQAAYISSYGWRLPIFSLYPNITSMRLAQDGEPSWSLVRYLGFGLWLAALLAAGIKLYRVTRQNGLAADQNTD